MKIIIALCSIAMFASVDVLAGEIQERNAIRAEVAAALFESNFDRLEQIAEIYRTTDQRTSSGTLKLDSYFLGLSKVMRTIRKDDDAAWSSLLKVVEQWRIQFPESPLPYIVHARALAERGGAYRGEDYAYRVSDVDIREYKKYSNLGFDYLVEHKVIASKHPYWYVQAIELAKAVPLNKGDFHDLVYDALDRFPNFDKIYFAAIGYLHPKWFGSNDELYQFVMNAVAKTMIERDVEMYARLYWAAGHDSKGRRLFQQPPANWGLMIQGMDTVLEHYSTQWNINHFAYFSCVRGDLNAAQKYLDMIEEPIIVSVWNKESNYIGCKNAAEVFGARRPN